MIAVAIPSVADTMIGDSTFGRICRVMIWLLLVPMDRAARTNSRSLMARTSPRTIRAVGIHEVMPMAQTIRMKIPRSSPNAADRGSRNSSIMTSSKGSRGRARNRSVRRISGPSSRLKNPATTPMNEPRNSASSIAVMPTDTEVCPPDIIRAKISRPNWSVPKGCAQLGP